MKEEILVDLGLSKNESKIYISLLETGFATATKIAEASGIHRVNVYDSVNKLKDRGLVGEVSVKGKKCYQAAPPETLKNIIKEKEMRLNRILPELALASTISKNKHEVEVYHGYDFIRNMFISFVNLGEDILDMNVPKFVLDQMGKHFQETIHKRRAEQNQNMYHIYSKEAKERIHFLNTLPCTFARCMKDTYEHNVTTTICGDQVAIQIYYEEPKAKPITILIKNKEIAGAYKKNFWLLWDRSVVPEK
tara:strand:+ start:33568 stop:34314 length:747 start_codon:yes stop_codon:yes gene_type:complete